MSRLEPIDAIEANHPQNAASMTIHGKHPYWGSHRHHACPLDAGHDGPCACHYCDKIQDHMDGGPDA